LNKKLKNHEIYQKFPETAQFDLLERLQSRIAHSFIFFIELDGVIQMNKLQSPNAFSFMHN